MTKRFLSEADAQRLPADLDLDAVDELLGTIPPEGHASLIDALMDPVPPPEAIDWAVSKRLGSPDPRIRSIIQRIYARRPD